jgi:hypothetical protein
MVADYGGKIEKAKSQKKNHCGNRKAVREMACRSGMA